MVDRATSGNGYAENDYESIIRRSEHKQGVKVTRVAATQLTRVELKEMEHIREIALDRVRTAVGDRGFTFTFEHEMNLWPADKTPSDKMVYRCFSDGVLVGYSLVVRGWPEKTQWTIQHMIVHPDHRNQGFGTTIVQGIEQDAIENTESIDRINVFPLHNANDFYGYLGYGDEREISVPVKNVGDRTLKAYSKKIR